MTGIVAPRIFSAVSPTSGEFPFGFGRQAIGPAILLTKPLTEFHGFETGDIDHGMIGAGAIHSFRLVSRIELLELRVRNRMLRDVKTAKTDRGKWLFVRLRFRIVASHEEIPGRKQHHGCADRISETRGKLGWSLSYLRNKICDWFGRLFRDRRAILAGKLNDRLGVALLHEGEFLVLEKFIEQFLTARRIDAEIFRNLGKHRADSISRGCHVKRAETENTQVFLFRLDSRRSGDLGDGSRRGDQRRAPGALPFQFFFNAGLDLIVGQAVLLAEFHEVGLRLGGQYAGIDRKPDELDQFVERVLACLRSEPFVHFLPPLRIEQIESGLDKVIRSLGQAAPEQLRHRITRLIFQRQFALPPLEKRGAMLLNQLVARLRFRIETKALVGTVRAVFAPAVPLPGIVGENRRRRGKSKHNDDGEAWWRRSGLQLLCPVALGDGRNALPG